MNFEYEPSWDHTLDSFKARQSARARKAQYDATIAQEVSSEAAVFVPVQEERSVAQQMHDMLKTAAVEQYLAQTHQCTCEGGPPHPCLYVKECAPFVLEHAKDYPSIIEGSVISERECPVEPAYLGLTDTYEEAKGG